jgi:hypothetical protein
MLIVLYSAMDAWCHTVRANDAYIELFAGLIQNELSFIYLPQLRPCLWFVQRKVNLIHRFYVTEAELEKKLRENCKDLITVD